MGTKSLSIAQETKHLCLKELVLADAKAYHHLYNHPKIQEVFSHKVFEDGENALQFIQRILNSCEYIWTIRTVNNQRIIGDCALHHYDKSKKEVCFGGILHPDHWGKGCMQWAFEQVKVIVKKSFNVNTLMAFTSADNPNAIRFALKMGFSEHYRDGNDICLAYRY